jgi:hypothetical protein
MIWFAVNSSVYDYDNGVFCFLRLNMYSFEKIEEIDGSFAAVDGRTDLSFSLFCPRPFFLGKTTRGWHDVSWQFES